MNFSSLKFLNRNKENSAHDLTWFDMTISILNTINTKHKKPITQQDKIMNLLLHPSISLPRYSKIFSCSSRWTILAAMARSFHGLMLIRMQTPPRHTSLIAVVSIPTWWSFRISPKQAKATPTFKGHHSHLRRKVAKWKVMAIIP